MNSMVVQVMSGKLYGSIMALEGYSAFHHLLLVLLDVYPELKAKVDDIIRSFLKSDSARHKHEVRLVCVCLYVCVCHSLVPRRCPPSASGSHSSRSPRPSPGRTSRLPIWAKCSIGTCCGR